MTRLISIIFLTAIGIQIIFHAILFGVGAIIAGDFDISNWLVITTWWGRLILLFIEIWFLRIVISTMIDTYKKFRSEI